MGGLYIINHYGTELSKGLCVLDKKEKSSVLHKICFFIILQLILRVRIEMDLYGFIFLFDSTLVNR